MNKKFGKTIILVLSIFVILGGVFGIDYSLDLATRVYDRAGVIDEAVERQIDDQLLELERTTIAQMIIVTLESLEGRAREEVTLNFGRQVGVGDKIEDTGIVLLISLEERIGRFEVGYGLEGIITDFEANNLAQKFLISDFRQGNYQGGIKSVTNEIVSILQGEKELEGYNSTQSSIGIFQIFIIGIFIAIFLGGMIATGRPTDTTKTVTSSIGSGLTGLVAVLMTTGRGLLIAIPLYFVRKASLNADRKISGGYGGGFRGRGFSGGGSFSSGGGFGGFGGGSFGGGGANFDR